MEQDLERVNFAINLVQKRQFCGGSEKKPMQFLLHSLFWNPRDLFTFVSNLFCIVSDCSPSIHSFIIYTSLLQPACHFLVEHYLTVATRTRAPTDIFFCDFANDLNSKCTVISKLAVLFRPFGYCNLFLVSFLCQLCHLVY